MSRRIIVGSAALASLLSLVLHVALNSPISPLPLVLPPPSTLKPNNLLKRVEKLGEGILKLPEDICFGKDGKLYASTRDGWIKRMHANGTWEDWKLIGGVSLLGITPSMDGGIIVCDANQGLLKVEEEGIIVLATHAEDTKISFADDAIEASDGSIYFSDASSKFGFKDWFLDILEARPNGRIHKYDPVKKTTSVLLSSMNFPNGVALSKDEDYLLVSETWKYRVLKHWLKGELKGRTEVFVDNLPAAPDNINLAPDGSFWIALIQIRSYWLDLIYSRPSAKLVLAAFPMAVEMMSKSLKAGAMVINVDEEGKIRRMLDDADGEVLSFVTSALEREGHLYLGSLGVDFAGKLPLNA